LCCCSRESLFSTALLRAANFLERYSVDALSALGALGKVGISGTLIFPQANALFEVWYILLASLLSIKILAMLSEIMLPNASLHQ